MHPAPSHAPVKRDLQAPVLPERRRLLAAVAGMCAVLASLLVPAGKPIEDAWAAGAWNLLHLPGFAFLTLCLHRLLGGIGGGRRRLVAAAGLALAAGIATELVQGRIGRSASLHDLVLDGFGILLAAISLRAWRWAPIRAMAGTLVLLGGFAFAFAPAVRQDSAERRARARLPVLGAFAVGDADAFADARRLWKTQGKAVAEVVPGSGALRVRIDPGEFGGVHFLPGRQDWSPYAELVLTLSNPGPPLRLGVRIDDADSAADRTWFSGEITAGGERSEVRVPLPRGSAAGPVPGGRRSIDFSRIRRLVLFVDKTAIPVEFSLHSAVLRQAAGLPPTFDP